MHGRNREGSWLRRWRLSLAALSGLALAAGAQAQERTTKTKYVDSLNFEIPIILRENPENIRELQLWASSDQGKSWQKVKTADPARKKIRMTAQNDSEWLFTMVFVDKTGRSTPADVERAVPHLRVMVDTSKPVVNLEAMPPKNENCGVRWSIDEASPDLESLKVELRTKKDPTWFQLKNVAPRLQGEVEWPCDPGDDYEVRVTLADRAGHSAVKNIEIAGMPGESVRGSKPAPPIAAREREYDRDWMPERPGMIKRSQAMKTAQREAPVGSADLKAEPLPGPRVVNAADEGVPTPPRPAGRGTPAVDAPVPPTAPTYVAAPAVAEAPFTSASPAGRVQYDPTRIDMAPDRQPEPIARAVVANKPKTRVRGDGSIRPVGAVEGELEPMPSPVPEEPKIKLVASERMRLSYDIAGAGPAGVGRVYLYFTRDGGKTWELCCEDADLQSPIEAELPGEGAYGLSIIVVNKAETGRHKPAPGELPQMLVHVDKTKPVALLKKPTPNPESPRDELVLSWESSDEHPTDKAVDLYYTPDPDVGWHKIARNLPASGKHAWRIPDGVPHLVFFRLVARDQCGNEERITTERPISIDLSNPQAKLGSVIDVLPAPKNDD